MSNKYPEYDSLLAGFVEANQFKNTFDPIEGEDYKWVAAHAQAEYGRALESFKRVDEKAAAILNYLTGGTGLLTLGGIAGLSGGQMSPWVILAAIPSFLLASVAMFFAVEARRTRLRAAAPSVVQMVAYVAYFGNRSEAAIMGQWNLCIAVLQRVIGIKGQAVDRSLWCIIGSVFSLVIPLGVALARKFMELQ